MSHFRKLIFRKRYWETYLNFFQHEQFSRILHIRFRLNLLEKVRMFFKHYFTESSSGCVWFFFIFMKEKSWKMKFSFMRFHKISFKEYKTTMIYDEIKVQFLNDWFFPVDSHVPLFILIYILFMLYFQKNVARKFQKHNTLIFFEGYVWVNVHAK